MDLFSLVATLGLDSSKYKDGLDEAKGSLSDFGNGLNKMVSTAKKAIAAIGIGAAVKKGVDAFKKGVSNVAQIGDNIDKASQKLGIIDKAYQEWDAVLQHSGASIDSLGTGMKTLATKAQSGSEAFAKLGISQERAAKMSREDLFSETVTALQNVEDANTRSALAMELFGKSAMELGPLLNTSAEDTQAMKDRVNELGGVLSEDAVKASAAYQDSLQDMTTALDGMKNNFFARFLPSITKVMDGITDVFTGNGGTDKIRKGVKRFVNTLSRELPKFLKKGGEIALEIGKGMLSAIPDVAEQVLNLLFKGLGRFAFYLPDISAKLIDWAVGLAERAGELVPKIGDALSEKIPLLFLTMQTALTHALSELSKALAGAMGDEGLAGFLFSGFTEARDNVIDALGALWEAFKTLWNAISDALTSLYENAIKPLVGKALTTFITETLPALTGKFKEIAEVIRDEVVPWLADAWGNTIQPAIETAFTAISDLWEDPLKPAFDGLLDIINSIWDFIKTNFAPIFETLTGALTGDEEATTALKNAMDELLPIITGAVTAFVVYKTAVGIASIIEAVTKATQGMSIAQAILNAVMNANPLAIVAGLLAGLAAALVTAYETNDEFREKVDAAWSDIKTWAEDTFQAVVDWFNEVGETLQNVYDTYLEPVGTWLSDTFTKAWDGIKDAMSGLIDFINDVFSGDWGKAWQSIVDLVATPFNALGEILKTPINAVIDLLNGMIGKVKDALNTVVDFINNSLSLSIPKPEIQGDWRHGFRIALSDEPLWSWSPNISRINWDDNPIQKLANGGILRNGQRAIVGEYAPEFLQMVGGQAVVTPLSSTPGRFPGGGQEYTVERDSGRDLTVIFQIDGQEAGKLIYRLNNEETQRVGVRMGMGGV